MLHIRDYTLADQEAVVRLHVEAMVHAGVYRGPNLHEADMHDIEGTYVQNGGTFLVGESNGAIVAMGAFKEGRDGLAELKRMRVLPSEQGKGLGREMFIALEQRARAMGYQGFYFETSVQQISAQKLYESRGCVRTGIVHIDGFDCIEYEKHFRRTVIETARTYLREMTPEDYADLCEILQDPEVMYAYWHGFDDEKSRAWLERQFMRYARYGFGLWALIDKKTGAFVGEVGLTMQEVEGREELEIGYHLKKKYWHMGYATEAAIACRDYAFNALHQNRVTCIIRDTNIASQNVARRIGMQPESTFFKHTPVGDILHDVFVIEK